jgi:hypothetical protein
MAAQFELKNPQAALGMTLAFQQSTAALPA